MRLMDRATQLGIAVIASIGLNAFAAEPEAVPGEYIVRMRTPVQNDKATMNTLSEQLGSYVRATIPGPQLLVVQRPVFEKTDSAIEVLSQNPDVEFVEPNYIYSINKTPDDPMFGQLWGLNNTRNPGVDINAVKAWEIETGNENLVVAVIDTGINYLHPDLAGNMWTNEPEARGETGVDDDGNGVVDDIYGYNAITQSGDPMDDQGHGTHCAGTIAGKGNDAKGVVGVAWNLKLMASKFLSASGSGTLEGAIRAIDYANRMGAKVLSNSWGGGGFSQALKDVIEQSYAAGSVFVAAAGNSRMNNDSAATYPANYEVPNVISVAALDINGKLAGFSNYGKSKVHVAAPGVDIVSTVRNEYATYSGTSMAAPHVSGVAALMISHDPTLDPVTVKERLIATTKLLPSLKNKVKSGGIVNAEAALLNIVPPPDMDDPSQWASVPVSISTAHPYAPELKETYEVSVDGASQISIFFKKFETESGYDTVTIKAEDGSIVETLTGVYDETYSAVIRGSRATIEFKTDRSSQKYGFDITKVAYR